MSDQLCGECQRLHFDSEFWNNNEIFLTLQAQRRAGSGMQEVTLTGGESTTTDHLEVFLIITLEWWT